MDIKNMKVLSIDDNTTNLLLVESYANTLDVTVKSFSNSVEGLNEALNNEYDLLIVDYMMPDLNGLELIKKFREVKINTPIIMLTAAGDNLELHVNALNAGASDFLSKPIVAPAFKARVTNLLQMRKNQLMLRNKALLLEVEVKKATELIAKREYETLNILGKTAEYKDPETAAHVARVAHYSKILAKAFGLNEETQDILFYAAPFHDIGKVGISDAILLKPAKLTDEEFVSMKKHSNIGYEILKSAQSKYLKAGGIIALTHHEKYDGSGYPNGLSGESIPIFGRIVAVVDVFDALTSIRPYKKAWSFEEAMNFLNDQKGNHFDPKLIECFLANIDEIKKIYLQIQE